MRIDAGGEKTERGLRPARKLVVAQRHDGQRLVYSPAGAMTRGELEAVGEHFDTLAIASVLPGKEVKTLDKWELSKAAAGPLCNLDGVTDGKLEGKLLKVEVDQAHFAVTGTVNGVENGAHRLG